MAEVTLKGVSKRFGRTTAVSDLDLTIRDGEFFVVLGPTGAGKTTTLRLIAGLEKPDDGTIIIAGEDATASAPSQRDVSFVFQQYSLYPHLSVYDNLAFPLRAPSRKIPATEVAQRVERVAKMVRIDHKLQSRSTRLSGGEMQRVAIGRALIREPNIYLMDEPLSSLDAKLRVDLRLEIKRIQRDMGATILYVTHDAVEAMTLADRIGILREGQLVQQGSPREIYERPRNIYAALKLGRPAINLIAAELMPAEPKPPNTVTFGARTEHITITRGRNGKAAGRVVLAEHLGNQSNLLIDLKGTQVLVLVPPESTLGVGEEVELNLRNPLFFDREGERIEA
jgi:multiple sugar transport system ATP-binding protein